MRGSRAELVHELLTAPGRLPWALVRAERKARKLAEKQRAKEVRASIVLPGTAFKSARRRRRGRLLPLAAALTPRQRRRRLERQLRRHPERFLEPQIKLAAKTHGFEVDYANPNDAKDVDMLTASDLRDVFETYPAIAARWPDAARYWRGGKP